MNGTSSKPQYTDILNPFKALIDSGIEIRDALAKSVTQLELATEAEFGARKIAKEAREAYEAAEAEFLAEAMLIDGSGNGDGKKITVDQRKAQVEAALVNARAKGDLVAVWALRNASQWDWEEKKVALDQCSARFAATRSASELTAAMLRAAAR
jgi:hypothetical protein